MKDSKKDIKIPVVLLFLAVLLGAVLIMSKCYETGACEDKKLGKMDEEEKQPHFWKCRDSNKKKS
jgi:hypothetical protein